MPRPRLVFFLILGSVFATVLACAVFLTPFPGIPFDQFDETFRDVIYASGFRPQEISSAKADRVPLAWNVALRKRIAELHPPTASTTFAFGFPNTSVRYVLSSDIPPKFECIVRYLDARASAVAIYSDRSHRSAAELLAERIRQKFPGLPTTLYLQ